MTYVIAAPCIGSKDTACVDVCPVDCIHPGRNDAPTHTSSGRATFEDATQLFIDPETCIDCGACEPACPVQAIFPADLLPEQWRQYRLINARYYDPAAQE